MSISKNKSIQEIQTGQQQAAPQQDIAAQPFMQRELLQQQGMQELGQDQIPGEQQALTEDQKTALVMGAIPEKARNSRSRLYKKRKNAFALEEAEADTYKTSRDILKSMEDSRNHSGILNMIFSLNVSEESVASEEAIAKNAKTLELLSGSFAVMEGMEGIQDYIEALPPGNKNAVKDRLNVLRQLCAYYLIQRFSVPVLSEC